jgi:hypothetical protein
MSSSADWIIEDARAEEALEAWELFQKRLAEAMSALPEESGRHGPEFHAQLAAMHRHTDAEIQKAKRALGIPALYPDVGCSNCGGGFGPGDHGFSHCQNHSHLRRVS